jgi:hypothetical protein
MGRMLRKGVVFTLLLGLCAPAWAIDPLIMFLLNAASEAAMRTAERNAMQAPPPAPPPDRNYPGTQVEPAQLRKLIDDSFLHLSSAQKKEVFDKLNTALLDPKNAAVRAPMIEHFTVRALQVRAAQQYITALPPADKQRLAREFRREAEALPLEDQAKLAALLRQGLLPVPRDFNQLLLATLAEPQ